MVTTLKRATKWGITVYSTPVNIAIGGTQEIHAAADVALSQRPVLLGALITASVDGHITYADSSAVVLSGVIPILANSGHVLPVVQNPYMPWLIGRADLGLEIISTTAALDGFVLTAMLDIEPADL